MLLSNRSVTAQPAAPVPTCPAEQGHAFDFLVGRWSGVVFDLKGADSAAAEPTAEVTSTRLFDGCALEERWHFEQDSKTEVDDVVLRAFDMGYRRMVLSPRVDLPYENLPMAMSRF
jgi:hypothetical protein